MSRKRTKPQPQPAKPEGGDPAATASLLPMEIQVGDRFTDHGFEWEALTHPAVLHGGKSRRAWVARPGVPETERDMTWAAHERVAIRRTRIP